MGDYRCWGSDHEDLKEQVLAKVITEGFGTLDVARLVGSDRDFSGHWRVIVKCSQGHDNAFEGDGLP